MSDDFEDSDYMSDSIMNACAQNDVRPGLIVTHSRKRTHEIEKLKKISDAENLAMFPKVRIVEAQRREEGLKEQLGAENKGFAMMQKMGYKSGTGIGKQGGGILEPVGVVMKSDRQGFGREAALKEVAAQKMAIRCRQKKSPGPAIDATTYRLRLAQQANEKIIVADLQYSQRVCEQLDMQQLVTEPLMACFWPEREKPKPMQDADEKMCISEEECSDTESSNMQTEPEDQFDPQEQLEMLTLYLRRRYLYCVWCGIRYTDEQDLLDSCPGMTRDDH